MRPIVKLFIVYYVCHFYSGINITMTTTTYITIDSRKRASGNTCDAVYFLDRTLQGVKGLKLSNMQFYNMICNINQYNNTIAFTVTIYNKLKADNWEQNTLNLLDTRHLHKYTEINYGLAIKCAQQYHRLCQQEVLNFAAPSLPLSQDICSFCTSLPLILHAASVLQITNPSCLMALASSLATL